MTIMQLIEAKPIVSIATTLVALGAAIGLLFTVDERYAHAGDLKQLGMQMEIQALDQRSTTLKDRVFDLEQKKKTPADQASLSRYQVEQRDIDRQLLQKRQMLDQMKNGK